MVMRRTQEQIKKDVAEGKKVCIECLERLPEIMFRARKAFAGGRVSRCRECEKRIRNADTNNNRRTVEELKSDIKSETKVCNKCGTRLPFDNFRILQKSADGRGYTCRDCANKADRELGYNRGHHLKQLYGITQSDYDKALKAQDYKCAVCLSEPTGKGLYVDHNHDTMEVRGLLCHSCNTMLGHSKDSSYTLRAGADYLDRTSSYAKE